MTKKKVETRLKLNPKFNKTLDTNLNVWSHDENSYEFRFEFYDDECDMPIDLTNAKAKMLLIFKESDEKKHLLDLDIEDETLGIAKFTVPKNILGYEGTVNAHIYIDFEGKTHDFGNFLFRMKRSAIDEDFPELDTVYVSEFEKALEEIQEILRKFDGVEMDIDEKIKQIEQAIEQHELEVEQKLNDINTSIDDRFDEINTNVDESEQSLSNRYEQLENDMDDHFKQIDESITQTEQASLERFDKLENDVNEKLETTTTNIDKTEANVLTKLDELDKKIDDKDVAKWNDVPHENMFAGYPKNEILIIKNDNSHFVDFNTNARHGYLIPVEPNTEYSIRLKYNVVSTTLTTEPFFISLGYGKNGWFEKDIRSVYMLKQPGESLLESTITTPSDANGYFSFRFSRSTIPHTSEVHYKSITFSKTKKPINFKPSVYDTAYRQDVANLQKQIDELKNAILNQGGTM